MVSKHTKSPTPQLASAIVRYGQLISSAARRGYSQKAINALVLSALAADKANRARRAVVHA